MSTCNTPVASTRATPVALPHDAYPPRGRPASGSRASYSSCGLTRTISRDGSNATLWTPRNGQTVRSVGSPNASINSSRAAHRAAQRPGDRRPPLAPASPRRADAAPNGTGAKAKLKGFLGGIKKSVLGLIKPKRTPMARMQHGVLCPFDCPCGHGRVAVTTPPPHAPRAGERRAQMVRDLSALANRNEAAAGAKARAQVPPPPRDADVESVASDGSYGSEILGVWSVRPLPGSQNSIDGNKSIEAWLARTSPVQVARGAAAASCTVTA